MSRAPTRCLTAPGHSTAGRAAHATIRWPAPPPTSAPVDDRRGSLLHTSGEPSGDDSSTGTTEVTSTRRLTCASPALSCSPRPRGPSWRPSAASGCGLSGQRCPWRLAVRLPGRVEQRVTAAVLAGRRTRACLASRGDCCWTRSACRAARHRQQPSRRRSGPGPQLLAPKGAPAAGRPGVPSSATSPAALPAADRTRHPAAAPPRGHPLLDTPGAPAAARPRGHRLLDTPGEPSSGPPAPADARVQPLTAVARPATRPTPHTPTAGPQSGPAVEALCGGASRPGTCARWSAAHPWPAARRASGPACG